MPNNRKMKHSIKHSQKLSVIEKIFFCWLREREDISIAYLLFGSMITSESFSDIGVGALTKEELAGFLNFEIDLEKVAR